jgi:uncharacterized protein YkwD
VRRHSSIALTLAGLASAIFAATGLAVAPAPPVAAAPAAAAAAAAAPATCANPDRIAANESQRRQAVRTIFCLVNIERQNAGLVALKRSIQLEGVGQRQSDDQVRYKYVGHVNHAGQALRARVIASGYPRLLSGEAVLWGTGTQRSPTGLVHKLMTTPTHRRVIMSPRYRDLGVGLTMEAPLAGRPDGATLTLVVGRRR